MKDHIVKNGFFRYFSSAKWIPLGVTASFFIIFLFLFHPGYGINDDLKIISLAAGYPGADPAPFLVYSNALVGFALIPLYALHSAINWEILIFVVINFLSVWVLLQIILSGASGAWQKIITMMVILACNAYFILNITYTTTAAFACLSGICLILAASRSSIPLRMRSILGGTALIFVGSLLRFEIFAIILSITLPVVLPARGIFKIKNLVLAFIIPVLFVAAGYAFNRAYLHFTPDWHTYNIYDKTRQLIDDTHRLENLHSEIHFIGWSGNDQELFAHWFFPDKRIYSIGHLQYLVRNISGVSNDKLGMASAFFQQLITPGLVPYVLFLISTWFWMAAHGLTKKVFLSLLTILALCLADNLYLAWAWKIADRTIYSSLLTAVVFSVVLVDWFSKNEPDPFPAESHPTRSSSLLRVGAVLIWGVALILVLNQSFLTSRDNSNKQSAYQKVLLDMKDLVTEGIIPPNSLIISPAHGLPMEWSNPFTLSYPPIPYLDTGWITFSPLYEQVLGNYGIQYLPDALYQKNNIYLMTMSDFTVFLGRYYREHENLNVMFQPIYIMPNTYHFAGFDDIKLYKVIKSE